MGRDYKLHQLFSNHPLIFAFRVTNKSEIYSVNVLIKKDVNEAFNSEEYHKIQALLKYNVLFPPFGGIGLTRCIRFAMLITKK